MLLADDILQPLRAQAIGQGRVRGRLFRAGGLVIGKKVGHRARR
jgi:hypothetical protein